MKKFTFLWAFFLLLGSICTVSAEDYISLTFQRTGTSSTDVSVVVTGGGNVDVSGVTAEFVSVKTSDDKNNFLNSNLCAATTANPNGILCPNVNIGTADTNTATMVFKITGLSSFDFTKMGLHTIALNYRGDKQNDNLTRTFNINASKSSDNITYDENPFVSVQKNLMDANADALWEATHSTVTSTDPLYIKLDLSRVTNNGCYFGLKEIRLIAPASIDDAKEARDAHQNLPGYPKATYYDALNSAISTYETTASEENLTALQTAYNTYLETTDVILPENGKAYVIKHMKFDGTFKYLADVNGGLKANVSEINGKSTFIYTTTNDGKAVFVNSETGKYLIYKGFSDTFTPNNGAFTLTSSNGQSIEGHVAKEPPFGSFRFDVVGRNATQTNNSSILIFTTAGEPGDCSQVFFYETGSSGLYQLEEVTDYTYNKAELKTSGDKAYSTLYLPYATTIPGDVQAYRAATLANNTLTMAEVTGTIPAETGVVLVGDAATHTFAPALEAGEEVTSLLTGIVNAGEAISNPDSKVICALNGANTIGFYKFTGTVRPGKAYLLADATMQAKGFTMNFAGETTGIEGIVTENTDKVVYDLSGRRIQNPTKGLYIIGGKKVYIK